MIESVPAYMKKKEDLKSKQKKPVDYKWDGKESLGEYVRRVREAKDLTQWDVVYLSDKGLSPGHVARIEGQKRGEKLNITVDTIVALATALAVPQYEIAAAAGIKIADPAEELLKDVDLNLLPPRDAELVIELVRRYPQAQESVREQMRGFIQYLIGQIKENKKKVVNGDG